MSTKEEETTQRFEIAPLRAGAARLRGTLTVLAGPRAGLVLEIGDDELVLGRRDSGDLALDDPSLSRRHARFKRIRDAFVVEDLGSTNGTFVEGVPVTTATTLADGAAIQLGNATLLRFARRDEAELEARRHEREATVRDALTSLYNRAFLDERLAAELSYARRHGTVLAALFVDADHFKRVNDTHGHAAGDAVLRAIADFIRATLRTEDLAARYGGEEIVVLVRGIPEPGVRAVAERIRAGIAKLAIPVGGATLRITVSIGVAIQSPDRLYADGAELLGAADAALYRAKERGRNRVELA